MTDVEMQGLVERQAESFEALMEKKAEIEKQIQAEGKDLFYNSVKSIFDQYGDILHSFAWTQYTPYFNDGDECVFGVHELSVRSHDDMKNEDIATSYYETMGDFSEYGSDRPKIAPKIYRYRRKGSYWDYNAPRGEQRKERIEEVESASKPWGAIEGTTESFDNPAYDPRYKECLEAVEAARDRIDENTMKTLFGDHTVVIVSADGVETEFYEHE